MKKTLIYSMVLLSGLFITCNKENDGPDDKIEIPEGYSFVWSDEFNGSAINPTNWVHQTGDGTDYGLPSGWGNNEKQVYTSSNENSSIIDDNGVSALVITARNNGGNYTSARLTTKDLISIRFGRLDIRAKMPEGQGIWPAVWLLGDNLDLIDWPGCGEIDILEVLGHQPSIMYSTLHYTNGVQEKGEVQHEYQLTDGDFSDSYHVFSMDWTPEALAFSLDGKQIYTIAIEDDMKEFLRSTHLILNIAVGGNWPGNPDQTTVFPQTMYVDYVRLFSRNGFTAPEPPALDIEEETIGQVIEPNIGDHAIRDDFTALGSLSVIAYGGGGEPYVMESDTAIDGDKSLVFDFPGGNWGGAYIELASPKDLSGYSYLKFSLFKPASLVNAEIKLESASANASLFLADYTASPAAEGFEEYIIPLEDFTGLDLTHLKIPFAIWNPQDAGQNFVKARVLIDNVYFSN